MTEDSDKWRKYVHGVANPRIEDGLRTEQNQGTSTGSIHIISYKKFIVRPLLREPRPWVHYKSEPNAKTPKKKQKSTSLTKTV